MMRLERILEKSRVYKEILKIKGIEIKEGEPFVVYLEDEITIWVPKNLSEEARAGIIIFELLGYYCEMRVDHTEHLITAYKLSTDYEKRLIWKAAKEYFGKDLEKRRDYGFWRLFKIF